MASIKKSPHVHHRHFCHFQLDTCQSCQLVKQHKRIFLHCKIPVSPNWLSKDFSPTMRPLSPHNEHCLSNWEKAGATFPFPPPFPHQQSASLSTVPPRPPPSSWSCCTMCIVCQIGWKLSHPYTHSLPGRRLAHNILRLRCFANSYCLLPQHILFAILHQGNFHSEMFSLSTIFCQPSHVHHREEQSL